MKRINDLFTKGTHWIWVVLLILFGFSCSEEKDEPQFPGDTPDPEIPEDPGGTVEYGTPYSIFRIKGKVVEESEQKPLPGMQVEIRYDEGIQDNPFSILSRDTLHTDADGTFEWVNYNYRSSDSRSVQIIPTEALEDNHRGPFVPDTTAIEFKREDLQNGSGWLVGETEKEITIVLKTVPGEGHEKK